MDLLTSTIILVCLDGIESTPVENVDTCKEIDLTRFDFDVNVNLALNIFDGPIFCCCYVVVAANE